MHIIHMPLLLHLFCADVTPRSNLPVDATGAGEVASVEKSGESSRNVVDCSDASYCVSDFCDVVDTDAVVSYDCVAYCDNPNIEEFVPVVASGFAVCI